MDRYIAVDVETTGLNPAWDRLIEIGAVRYENGQAVSKFEEFIYPGTNLPERIIEITNITDDMLKDARSEADVINDFIDFIGDDVILGHNIMFDYSFLKTAAVRYKIGFEKKGIDTFGLCAFFHRGMPSKSLGSMRKLYGISDVNSHRAYYDADAAAKLYEALKVKYYDIDTDRFSPKHLYYKVKKQELITDKQRKYLKALIAGHKMSYKEDIDALTKSDASRLIDKILTEQGKVSY